MGFLKRLAFIKNKYLAKLIKNQFLLIYLKSFVQILKNKFELRNIICQVWWSRRFKYHIEITIKH